MVLSCGFLNRNKNLLRTFISNIKFSQKGFYYPDNCLDNNSVLRIIIMVVCKNDYVCRFVWKGPNHSVTSTAIKIIVWRYMREYIYHWLRHTCEQHFSWWDSITEKVNSYFLTKFPLSNETFIDDFESYDLTLVTSFFNANPYNKTRLLTKSFSNHNNIILK